MKSRHLWAIPHLTKCHEGVGIRGNRHPLGLETKDSTSVSTSVERLGAMSASLLQNNQSAMGDLRNASCNRRCILSSVHYRASGASIFLALNLLGIAISTLCGGRSTPIDLWSSVLGMVSPLTRFRFTKSSGGSTRQGVRHRFHAAFRPAAAPPVPGEWQPR